MTVYNRIAVSSIICMLFALFINACASSRSNRVELKPLEPFPKASRYIVAVMPFQFKGEQETYSGLKDKLVDLAIDELFRTGRFRIVERGRIDAVINEITLSQQGVVNSSNANKIGQQLGAEMVLVGTLAAIKPIQKRDSAGVMWQETRGFEISLKGRLIDVKQGEVAAVASATGMETQEEKMALGAKTGVAAPVETLMNRALETAVRNLVHELAKMIAPK